MKTFTSSQLQEALEWRPQIERFITPTTIYVIETLADYSEVNSTVQELIDLRNSVG